MLALDEALSELAALDERKSRVVELRYFGGLNTNEVATALGVSTRTVDSDWAMARAWLRRRIEGRDGGDGSSGSAPPETGSPDGGGGA